MIHHTLDEALWIPRKPSFVMEGLTSYWKSRPTTNCDSNTMTMAKAVYVRYSQV